MSATRESMQTQSSESMNRKRRIQMLTNIFTGIGMLSMGLMALVVVLCVLYVFCGVILGIADGFGILASKVRVWQERNMLPTAEACRQAVEFFEGVEAPSFQEFNKFVDELNAHLDNNCSTYWTDKADENRLSNAYAQVGRKINLALQASARKYGDNCIADMRSFSA